MRGNVIPVACLLGSEGCNNWLTTPHHTAFDIPILLRFPLHMSVRHIRRSSSNGIRNLRAVFERNSASPSPEHERSPPSIDSNRNEGRSGRKVTASVDSPASSEMATQEIEHNKQEEARRGEDAPMLDSLNTIVPTFAPEIMANHEAEKTNGLNNTVDGHPQDKPQEYVLPPLNTQSEHTEKTISAVEDEDAQMQPGDITDLPADTEEETVTPAQNDEAQNALSNGHTEESGVEPKPPSINAVATAQMPDVSSKTPQRVGQPASTSKASFRPATVRQSISKVRESTPAASSKKPVTTRTSDAARKISTGPSKSLQPIKPTSVPTSKTSSSSKPSAGPSHHGARPSASTSAKPDTISLPTRNGSFKSKKPINSTSHLLIATTASSGRQEQEHDRTSSGTTIKSSSASVLERLSKPTVKRDRASLASTTNGTAGRAIPPSSTRNSLQPGAIRKASETSNTTSRSVSSTARPVTASGSSFLERMTRPTAASSGRAQTEKLAMRTSSLHSTTNGTALSNGSKSAATARPKPAAEGSLRQTAAVGAAQQKSNGGGLRSASSSKAVAQRSEVNENTPITPAEDGPTPSQSNNINSATSIGHDETIDKQDVDIAPRTSTPAVGGFEERMMETPDLRAGVIR